MSEANGEGTEGIPQYDDLAMMGLSIKSSPRITNIEQPRVWVQGSIEERLEANTRGMSNLFSDLLYYMLTNQTQGVGDVVPSDLVDRASFAKTGSFLFENKIQCNGVVETDQNIRSFATNQAAKNRASLRSRTVYLACSLRCPSTPPT